MLDDYIEIEPIAYRIFKNAVIKKRIMHAYLIEARGNDNRLNLAIAFAKYLLCPFGYSNLSQCQNCYQCQRINDGNFTEITVIEPDGQVIKKEQLDELQKKFSRKSLESSKKVYIINHAEAMNQSAANSILKFLEEPEENIIAILIVDNTYQLLSTIVSRCQIITLNNNLKDKKDMLHSIGSFLYDSKQQVENYCNDEESIKEIETIINFVKYYEKNHLDILLFMQKMWNEVFYDKIKVTLGLNLLLLFYRDILNYKMFSKIEYYLDFLDEVKQISTNINIPQLINKINAILKAQEKVYQNSNLNLLMDRLVLDMEAFE